MDLAFPPFTAAPIGTWCIKPGGALWADSYRNIQEPLLKTSSKAAEQSLIRNHVRWQQIHSSGASQTCALPALVFPSSNVAVSADLFFFFNAYKLLLVISVYKRCIVQETLSKKNLLFYYFKAREQFFCPIVPFFRNRRPHNTSRSVLHIYSLSIHAYTGLSLIKHLERLVYSVYPYEHIQSLMTRK